MKLEEVQQLKSGFYIIDWYSGGSSLASVGRLRDGTPWMAPTNWCNWEMSPEGMKKAWKDVKSISPLMSTQDFRLVERESEGAKKAIEEARGRRTTMKVKFECPNPQCSGDTIEEVLVGVIQSTNIMSVEGDDISEYGEHSLDGGEVTHFQCVRCGDVIKDENGQDITDQVELIEWLERNNMLEEE